MKTNLVMLSPDRALFGIKIRQQSKTGHLNLTDLQGAYAVARLQYGWSERNLTEVLNAKANAERIYYLLSERDFIKVDFSSFMEMVEKDGVIKVLKALAVYKTNGRAENKTTWCDPYIWVLIAMEMNPMLYAKTVTWLTDSLLLNRIEAGNMYRGLSGAMAAFPRVDYAAVAKALNLLVFGRHETGIRQTGTSAQLKELAALEENTAFSISMGFIRNQDQLLETLRQVWRNKFNNTVLAA
ncbi:hypothetical protein BEN47_16750 [Hymenobacter lapidarius]|uniref:Uncharacterized protein n=1 Tax=Hymenobacter lapidarius TaxID=1908237 RepID=A0A1G1SZU0_9BACT|nr:hypothetical protein [Hymenobacter lapidarius]OGX84126.1 hypothetical protein BEN47_16750 [Hymenobacter lapidarius]